MNDEILCYLLNGGQARAYIIRSTRLVSDAMRTHGLSHTAAAALGRTLTCAAAMGVQMKHEDDRLMITVNGGGPLGSITVAARNDGTVKGYVDCPMAELPTRSNGKLDVGGAVGAQGRLTVIKDLGMKEPYVGNVQLVTGEIGDDFAYYFATSEQQPCAVALGVSFDHGEVTSAGGVILQPLPGCDEETLSYLESCSALLAEVSSLFFQNSAQDVGKLLFWQIEHSVEASYPAKYACDCDRARLEGVLASLGQDEIDDMIREQHGAVLTCHFCSREYVFSEDELREITRYAAQQPNPAAR